MAIPRLTKRQLMNEIDRQMRDDVHNFTSEYFGERLAYMGSMLKKILDNTYGVFGYMEAADADAITQAFTINTDEIIAPLTNAKSNGVNFDETTGQGEILISGWYSVLACISFTLNTSATDCHFHLYRNNVETRLGVHHYIVSQNQHEAADFGRPFQLTRGDIIDFRGDFNKNTTATWHDINLSLIKCG